MFGFRPTPQPCPPRRRLGRAPLLPPLHRPPTPHRLHPLLTRRLEPNPIHRRRLEPNPIRHHHKPRHHQRHQPQRRCHRLRRPSNHRHPRRRPLRRRPLLPRHFRYRLAPSILRLTILGPFILFAPSLLVFEPKPESWTPFGVKGPITKPKVLPPLPSPCTPFSLHPHPLHLLGLQLLSKPPSFPLTKPLPRLNLPLFAFSPPHLGPSS